MLAKIGTSIEEMKKDSLNDMKTLSTMNTTLQVILESVLDIFSLAQCSNILENFTYFNVPAVL